MNSYRNNDLYSKTKYQCDSAYYLNVLCIQEF